uniref:RNase H domain-containing protein n=1 Tax=Strongyloides papillosus TaxID=174720 RepID=A0A0N5B1Q7_STREA
MIIDGSADNSKKADVSNHGIRLLIINKSFKSIMIKGLHGFLVGKATSARVEVAAMLAALEESCNMEKVLILGDNTMY